MIKITNLLHYDERQSKDSYVFKEIRNINSSFSFRFLYAINSCLKLKNKFFKDFYIASEDDTPKALIGIKISKSEPIRALVTNFILDENSLDVGEKLINYVVQKYSMRGVSTFFIHIDNSAEEIKNLFLSKANFRVLSEETFFDIKCTDNKKEFHNYIKPLGTKNIKKTFDLHNYLIDTNLKFYFQKSFTDFSSIYYTKQKLTKSYTYVIQNPDTEEVYAMFSLTEISNKNWVVEFFMLDRYSSYITDIIEFSNKFISSINSEYSIYLVLKKYFTSYNHLKDTIYNLNFPVVKNNLILSKDYLRQIKDTVDLKNSKIIFRDINPAY